MDTTSRRAWLTAAFATLAAYGIDDPLLGATPTVETRPVAGFDAVLWSAVGELHIEQTGRERLTIEAEPAVLAKIVTEVRQRRLSIGFAPGSVETRQPIRFRLEVVALGALETRGSGTVRVGALSVPALSLRLGGSDEVHMARLAARTLDVRLDGSGDLSIGGGEVDVQRVEIGGSGLYAAPALASRQAEVSIDGSGDARLAARERLVARIAGSGDVRYHGNPRVEQSVSGAGAVRRAP